ncbi:MAG: DNA polymerase III subunit delta, partial [Muribaculaceae bacterium]|nr:DNA polymerase III subunit delta [Muribaculaceae bacterium]
GSMFILVSNSPAEVLPTIYSRCQRIELRRLSDTDAASALADGFTPDANQLAAAHLAEGNVIAAREEAGNSKDSALFLDLFMALMRQAYARKIGELKKWSEQVADLGRETEARFLDYCQRMVRENFIYNLKIQALNYMTGPEQQFSERFCPFINERNVEQIISELNEAKTDIQGNGNAKIIFFDLAIKMIMLLKK